MSLPLGHPKHGWDRVSPSCSAGSGKPHPRSEGLGVPFRRASQSKSQSKWQVPQPLPEAGTGEMAGELLLTDIKCTSSRSSTPDTHSQVAILRLHFLCSTATADTLRDHEKAHTKGPLTRLLCGDPSLLLMGSPAGSLPGEWSSPREDPAPTPASSHSLFSFCPKLGSNLYLVPPLSCPLPPWAGGSASSSPTPSPSEMA